MKVGGVYLLFIRIQSVIANAAFALFGGVKETVVVEAKRYMKHLVEQANLHFIVTGKIKETGQIITAMKVVTLHNPELSVKVCPRPSYSPLCICFFPPRGFHLGGYFRCLARTE